MTRHAAHYRFRTGPDSHHAPLVKVPLRQHFLLGPVTSGDPGVPDDGPSRHLALAIQPAIHDADIALRDYEHPHDILRY